MSGRTEQQARATVRQFAAVDLAGASTETLQAVADELGKLLVAFESRGWADALTDAEEARSAVCSVLVDRVLAR